MIYESIILGGGPAGLTAGIYLSRAGKKVLLIEGTPGGLASLTERIENYPGFPDGISGMDLMSRFREQALHFGTEIQAGEATSIQEGAGVKGVHVGKEVFTARTVIIATGTCPRPLNIPGEAEFRGRGISYCATCDGPFFRGRPVAVIGGGDSAVKEALYLAEIASRVYLIHRRDRLRSEFIIEQKARAHPRIEIIWSSVPERVEGEHSLSGIAIRNRKTDQVRVIPVSGVFVYIGAQPQTGFLQDILELDSEGFIVTRENLETSVPGIFAAGDVRSKRFRQVATAVGDGALAAYSVETYLSGGGSSGRDPGGRQGGE